MGSLGPIRNKLAKAIGKLSEDTTDCDLAASARGLIRLLSSNGCTILDLMELVEKGKVEGGKAEQVKVKNGKYSEAELLEA